MQTNLRSKGIMLVLSSPSGAGKSSLARKLIDSSENIVLSISVTTRPIRPGEIDGKDYYFVDKDSFENRVREGRFLEWASVFGNLYGTPKDKVEESLNKVQDMVFDIDWQGARSLKQRMPDDVVSIYILPPSMEELRNRLVNRSQDSIEIIESRMQKAYQEASHYIEYDYVIINDNFDESLYKLKSILNAEHLKRHRQINLDRFVKGLNG
jgi:guanylate kinase